MPVIADIFSLVPMSINAYQKSRCGPASKDRPVAGQDDHNHRVTEESYLSLGNGSGVALPQNLATASESTLVCWSVGCGHLSHDLGAALIDDPTLEPAPSNLKDANRALSSTHSVGLQVQTVDFLDTTPFRLTLAHNSGHGKAPLGRKHIKVSEPSFEDRILIAPYPGSSGGQAGIYVGIFGINMPTVPIDTADRFR